MGSTKLIESEQGGIQTIGRYELIAEIASGGMATVYLARLSGVGGFQRNVAIKCLHPHLARDEEFVEMFLDEARLAALIHHPNVVPILEVGEDPGGFYLVMDYVEGDTFATLLSRAAMEGKDVPRDISLRILVDMLAGLHAAHDLKDDDGRLLGLVHRDVSPQNILIGTDGVTRITDFGVARAASRLSATRAGQLKGKLAYMAPEQASGDEAVDRRADVFSAGVVLWEALALKRLFKASNEVATLTRVLNDRIVSPREFSTDVPEEVARVCLKALQREVDARYESCGQFADELERTAAAASCLATGREVAAYVQQVVGASVESQRRAIRTWLQRRGRTTESSMPSIRVPGYAPPPPPSRRPPAGSDTSSVITSADNQRVPSAPPSVLSSRLAYHPPRPSLGPGAPGSSPASTTPVSYGEGSPHATLVSAPFFTAAPPPRRRWLWAAAALLVAGLAGAGLALLGGEQQPPVSAGQQAAEPSIAVQSPTSATPSAGEPAAGSAAQASAAASATASAQRQAVLDPTSMPAADEPEPEKSKASTRPKRSVARTRATPRTGTEPAAKPKGKAPDLDNPYQ